MGDVYGLLDGVALGLGRAVMSEHLVKNDKRFKVVSGYKTYKRPICLVWNKQGWYPRLQNEVVEIMGAKAKTFL